jgi:hypothetical protein
MGFIEGTSQGKASAIKWTVSFAGGPQWLALRAHGKNGNVDGRQMAVIEIGPSEQPVSVEFLI